MTTRNRGFTTRVLAAIGAMALSLPAFASSNFRVGELEQRNPVTGRDTDSAVCRLFLGPRAPIEDGEFLLEIGDLDRRTGGDVQQLRGTVVPDGNGSFTLMTDEMAAEDFYEQILRTKLHRTASGFDLHRLVVTVEKTAADIGDDTITCNVELSGFLTPAARDRSSRHSPVLGSERSSSGGDRPDRPGRWTSHTAGRG